MDEHEMRRWHQERESLFPTKLPYSALTVINAQLPRLEAERASRALVSYSKAKPYKGFYMLKYMVHYERVGDDETPFGTAGNAPKGALPPEPNDDGEYLDAERREREAYEALPDDYRERCKDVYADWGWPIGSRAWMLICLDAFVGRDVSGYKIGTNVFSKQAERDRKRAEERDAQERHGMLATIGGLRLQVLALGGSING